MSQPSTKKSAHYLSLSEAEVVGLANEGYSLIPLYTEMLGDLDSPVSLFYKMDGDIAPHSFLLESVVGRENIGRYSFLGNSFYKIIRAKGNQIEQGVLKEQLQNPAGRSDDVNKKPSLSWSTHQGNPLNYFTSELDFGRPYNDQRLPGFFGGAVGYISYDSIRYTEDIPTTAQDDLELPDVYFIFTDEVILFDHVARIIRPVVTIRLSGSESEADIRNAYAQASAKLGQMWQLPSRPLPDRMPFPAAHTNSTPSSSTGQGDGPLGLEVGSNMSDAQFEQIVRDSIEYIKAGDIFQIVPSRRFDFQLDIDPFHVYRALRVVNPSPYMYFFRAGELQIIGSSPEILLKGHGDTVEVRPIAGTRPRGKTPQEDAELETSLLADPKEIAEHLMLIDLGRNDIGRVADFNSVRVDDEFSIERYSHVMHIASTVKGSLRPGKTMVDALRSCLPAGTLSGAPKIRAMEIIDEFEPTMRGPYGGALGYFSFNGDTDTAIVIRTLVVKNGRAYLQAGAGIVYDSVPETERLEVKAKMQGLIRAVELALSGRFA